MPREIEHLLTLTGFLAENGTSLHLPERKDACTAELWSQLVGHTYDKPFVVDEAAKRALCFTIDGSVQSEMRLDDPTALVSEYTRKMMAFLLFCPQPRHVLMLGLGGGSIVKFCRRHLPETRMTVAEIDATVIGLRSHFHVPPDDDMLHVVHADGGRHVAGMAASRQSVDVLLADAYDRDGLATSTASCEFFGHARTILGDTGVFVMNLAAYESDADSLLRSIRAEFGEPVIALEVGWGGNMVVFAGPALRQPDLLAAIPERTARLRQELDLDFQRLPLLVAEQILAASSTFSETSADSAAVR